MADGIDNIKYQDVTKEMKREKRREWWTNLFRSRGWAFFWIVWCAVFLAQNAAEAAVAHATGGNPTVDIIFAGIFLALLFWFTWRDLGDQYTFGFRDGVDVRTILNGAFSRGDLKVSIVDEDGTNHPL